MTYPAKRQTLWERDDCHKEPDSVCSASKVSSGSPSQRLRQKRHQSKRVSQKSSGKPLHSHPDATHSSPFPFEPNPTKKKQKPVASGAAPSSPTLQASWPYFFLMTPFKLWYTSLKPGQWIPQALPQADSGEAIEHPGFESSLGVGSFPFSPWALETWEKRDLIVSFNRGPFGGHRLGRDLCPPTTLEVVSH